MSPVVQVAVVHPSPPSDVIAGSPYTPAVPAAYVPIDSSIASRGILAAVFELPMLDGWSGREFSRRDAEAGTG